MKRKESRKPAARKRSVTPRRRSAGPLALSSECLAGNAESLRQSLLRRLKQPSVISIDASNVGTVDAAGLQVLAAFARDCRDADRELEWIGVPPVLAEAARLLDLASMLGLPAADEALPA